MNLTDELVKLAALHEQGHLSDEEFVTAKTRLLTDAPSQTSLAPESLKTPERPSDLTAPPFFAKPVQVEERVFWASRWSSGNLFFRDRFTVAADGIVFRKGAMFGSNEEHISYRAIASLKVDHGIFLSDITIETAGGSQPVFINGLWKSDAKELQEIVRSYQAHEYGRL